MQKIVSQLDATGNFVGATVADESPLEPGVWLFPAGAIDVPPPNVSEGRSMRWTGQEFVLIPLPEPEPESEPQPPTVPAAVSMRQARLFLLSAGLMPSVEAAIAGLSEPQKSAVAIEWEYATTVEREWPTINALAALLGWDSAQLDDFFTQAAAL